MAIVEYESPVEVLTETEQRARTLEAAALEIEVRGWGKCDLDVDGRACVNGAIALAMGLGPEEVRYGTVVALWKSNIWSSEHPYSPIASWNDCRAKDGADAAFLLRWRAEEIRDGWDA